MAVFDFQAVTAVILATASFRHLRPAFCRRISERILSDSLDLVIVRAETPSNKIEVDCRLC